MNTLTVVRPNLQMRLNVIAGCLAVVFATVIPLSNALTIAASLLLAVFAFMQFDRATFNQAIKNPISIAILLFLFINILQSIFTPAAQPEIMQAFKKYSRLLYIPLLLPIFSQSRWRHAATIGFVAAVFISVVAALNASDHLVVFKDSIFTSLFVAFAIFVLAHYGAEYKKYRWLCAAIALLFTYYLFFINIGRAGQGLFVMLFLLFLWQRVPKKLKYQAPSLLILFLILATCALAPTSFIARQTEALNEVQQYAQHDQLLAPNIPHESSMGTRLILAQNSLQLIKKKPLLGWGTGSFKQVYSQYAPEAQITNIVRANPHNQYLLAWVELGLPGLLCLLYLFFVLTKQFISNKQLPGFLGTGLMLCMWVGCTMNSWLLDFTSMFFFVCFAAMFAAAVAAQQIR